MFESLRRQQDSAAGFQSKKMWPNGFNTNPKNGVQGVTPCPPEATLF